MYRTLIPPRSEVVSFKNVADHLRLDADHPQEDVAQMIAAARGRCEQFIEQAIGLQTVEYCPETFSPQVVIPFGPVHEVKTVTYEDDTGTEQSIASYVLKGDTIQFTDELPSIGTPSNCKITFTAGFTDEENEFMAPPQIVSAILLYVGDLYANREAQFVGTISTINRSAEALLMPYRRGMGI